MDLTVRARGAELMDEPRLEPSDIRTALDDLAGVNRWLGGWRVLRREMRRLLAQHSPETYSVLDVGTGGADLPLRLARWARKRGFTLQIVATDIHPQTLEVARSRARADPAVTVQEADALALPFPDAHFDFAICSTTLHHFDTAGAARALSELARVARAGIVVNDLRRSALAYAGARALAVTVWRGSRLTRHDGPLSVRRAFTPDELAETGRAAGLRSFRVRTHFPFRVSLTARFPGPGVP